MPAKGWTVIAHACHGMNPRCRCPEPRWQLPCAAGCRCGENAGPPPEPFISHACEFPADQQAVLVPDSMKRRHPWLGNRPEFSGYCVINACECECHQAHLGELGGEVRLDVFES